MAFNRPTLQELIDRTKADFESRLTGGGSLLRRAVARVLSRVHAGGMHLLYGYAAYIAKQLMPDTAEKEFLRRWARIWSVAATPATFAQFTVTFTGTDGISIPALTEVVRSDGKIYVTDADGSPSGGTVDIAVTAKESGEESNVEGGEELSMSSPIAGIDSVVTVSATGITDGVDEETDPALLVRLLSRIQDPPNGGSENDYVTWAKEVSGVTRAWCLPLYLGDGTVGVTFVRDNDAGSIIPSAGEVAAVQAYIDDLSRRPVTADVTVFAPIAAPLAFTISGISDVTVRAAVQAELEDLILREAEPGGTLLLSHIREAISSAQGENDHVLTLPAANVTVADGYLTTMGTITWV
jgi:uncharacterized phage protein gp47/JayE